MSSGHEMLVHSPLCTICASIFTSQLFEWDDKDDNGKPHHTTWESLEQSTSSGCYICARLREDVESQLIDIRFRGISCPGDVSDYELAFEVYSTNSDGVREKYPTIRNFPCIRLGKAVDSGMQMLLQSGTCSSNSMRQARDWIDKCRNTHNRCAVPQSESWLPARLVYVERSSTSTMFAKICDRDALKPSTSYLTLSHRWGSSKFMTLASNVWGSWQKKVPIEQLSRVFQEALHVTHELGFKYIWIDSLCIIQDDLEDWRRESTTMHRIYRGAICNLSASEFNSGEDGLINTQRLHNPLPPIVHPLWPTSLKGLPSIKDDGEGDKTVEQRIHALGPEEQYYLMEQNPFQRVYTGPLFYRAWILQEQILVIRRILMFPAPC